MNICDTEFFDIISENGIDNYTLRCIQCYARFDANFKNGYNTHYSIRCQRVIPACPICRSAADNLIGDDEKIENGLDNETDSW